jgi:hypothetical protein
MRSQELKKLVILMIKSEILKFLKRLALASGVSFCRRTPNQRLKQFFDKINPINIEEGLIRIGVEGEGGYLVPNDLSGVSACFSPGVSTEVSFDLDLAERGMSCYLADFSVDGPPVTHPKFDFEKKYVGPEDGEIYFTLEEWVNIKEPRGTEFILQMDIEGAEYGIILSTPLEVLMKFRILVIEFHQLHEIFSPAGFQLIDLTFRKLLKTFDIVHIHPNNCLESVTVGPYQIPPVMEFSFLRKDRVRGSSPAAAFPHSLDFRNAPGLPDIILPNCWRNAKM